MNNLNIMVLDVAQEDCRVEKEKVRTPREEKQEVGIVLGRLGIGRPEKLAPHLSGFVLPWLRVSPQSCGAALQAMSRVQWTEETGNRMS